MHPEQTTNRGNTSVVRAVRHHLAPVVICVLLGAVAGWLYASSSPASYTSVTRVLVNPSVGNPYAPTPSSVRQDELTSLETEAQVARSAEVLDVVAAEMALPTRTLERGLRVTVPPNTQVLEITYSASNPVVAQRAADAVATAYLDNRRQRFEDVNAARIDKVADRTRVVVDELRTATAASESGPVAERAFQSELAGALRSELVSLRVQRTALENSESPAGSVIAPASEPSDPPGFAALVPPIAGALAGLLVGCLLALLLERARGVVRSPAEVDPATLPVAAAVPPSRRRPWDRRRDGERFDTTIRRLRGTMLELDPRPDVVAIAPAGAGPSDADVAEAVAESFARAGHRVVLVQTEARRDRGGIGVERGLADALLHERLNPLDLLQPSVEPLLCILPAGVQTDQTRELFVANRLRALLAPLTDAGNLVVIQSPGVDTAEGEALVGASDLGLVVVTLGVTRPHEVDKVATNVRIRGTTLGALVVGAGDAARRTRRTPEDAEASAEQSHSGAERPSTRAPR